MQKKKINLVVTHRTNKRVADRKHKKFADLLRSVDCFSGREFAAMLNSRKHPRVTPGASCRLYRLSIHTS